MRRILKYIVLISICTVGIVAKPRSVEDINNVVTNFLKEKQYSKNISINRQKKLKSSSIDKIYQNDLENKSYHIIELEPQGWIIVSGDDVATPILAYSFDSNISDSEGNMPPSFLSWMKNIENNINRAKVKAIINEKSKVRWDKLAVLPEVFDENILINQKNTLSRSKSFRTTIKSIEPLLKTEWNQGKFYNTFTPTDSNGKHSPVGCAATAMGQIMKYHAWPARGIHKRVDHSAGIVNFNTPYNWENMPNKAAQGNSGNINIAKLLYHVGISGWMKYTTASSGAHQSNMKNGLEYFFKYETDGVNYRINDSDSTWHGLLKASIDNKRPIFYGGNNGFFDSLLDGISAHAFVIDGYKYIGTEKKYHFNWGWGGIADGDYSIDAIFPEVDTQEYDFNSLQFAIFNIRPKGRLKAPQNIYASDNRAAFVLLQKFKVTGATKYKIYRTSNKNTNVTEKTLREVVTGDIYLDRDATPNHVYYYYIKACNDDGCSQLSKYDTGIRQISAPSNIYASDNRSPYILIQNYIVSGATKYKIYRTSAAGTNVTEDLKIGESSSRYFVDRTALYGHTYYYYVKACNKQNICSGYSGYDTGYRKPVLSAPTTVSASDGQYSDRVVVGSYATNGATYYKIYRASSPVGKPVFRENTTSYGYTDTHALPGYTYYYYVEACNSKGCSVKSVPDVGYLENIDGVTLLHESTTIHGKHVGYKKMKYYKIRAKGVNVLLYNLGADIDVYIKYGSVPTVTSDWKHGDFDYFSYKGSRADDYISTATTDEERDIYIGVRGYYSGNYDLRVTKKY